jgi:hypothetical protein
MFPSFRPRWPITGITGIVLFLVCVTGCDTGVDVLQPSDEFRFSLFGALDVAKDTQVVRVEPIGDTTRIGAPEEIDAQVVLENLDTGTQVSMRDSFATVGGGIGQVHNFWTTHSLRPGTSYQIRVEEEGTAVTTATTTTPEQPPELVHAPDSTDDRAFRLPCRLDNRGEPLEIQNTFSFRVFGASSVAAVKVLYTIDRAGQDRPVTRQFDWLERVRKRTNDPGFRIPVFYGRDLATLKQRGRGCLARSQFARPFARATVTAGGPDWPDWGGASLNDLARPDTFSNVSGGHGFVGGVYTDTVRIPIQVRED